MLAEAIRLLTEDDLRFLNRLIIERLNLISQARSTVMLAHFSVGDRVSFASSSDERKSGVIIRLNKKTASITTDDGQHWNVHPGYLVAEKMSTHNSPHRPNATERNLMIDADAKEGK
jgi:hypothetical protein